MKLSILIPTIGKRVHLLNELLTELNRQIKALSKEKEVQIIVNSDEGKKSIGLKRNELLNRATGEYICFIDDDDRGAEYYLEEFFAKTKESPDVVNISGLLIYDRDPSKIEVFEHKLGNGYYTNTSNGHKTHYRYPNHLNFIKREKVKGIFFPETNFGEDKAWADQINDQGLLKTSATIEKDMYYYLYDSKK